MHPVERTNSHGFAQQASCRKRGVRARISVCGELFYAKFCPFVPKDCSFSSGVRAGSLLSMVYIRRENACDLFRLRRKSVLERRWWDSPLQAPADREELTTYAVSRRRRGCVLYVEPSFALKCTRKFLSWIEDYDGGGWHSVIPRIEGQMMEG